jgi:UDPglucose 6-dehydrogenase
MRPNAGDEIGIIGAGVVGGALLGWLRAQGRDAAVYDPPQGFTSRDAVEDAGVVFVCVPTPYTPGVGFDDSYLLEAVAAISRPKLVVIKSTVLPGTTDLLQERYPQHRFMFNPEFLREASAYDDFVNPDRQIVGCTDASRGDAERVMSMLPRAPFERICAAREAEMAKYAANSFLAVKVSFANEVFDLCARMRIGYDAVREIVGADARIGGSHMDVFDAGYRGYAGKCLPKDSKALLDLARSLKVELQVLGAADRVNSRLQPRSATKLRVMRSGTGVAEVVEEIEERAA